ncbi:MAG: MEDS domain-containing protein, partial [Candidatus Hydrogenedentales bacterium]
MTEFKRLSCPARIGSVSTSRTELLAAVAEFVGAGIERSGRCVVVTDGTSPEALLEGLSRSGLDAHTAALSGALIVADRANALDSSGMPLPRLTASATGRETWVAVVNPPLLDEGNVNLSQVAERALLARETCLANGFVLFEALETPNYPTCDPVSLLRMYPSVYSRGAICRNRYYIHTSEFLDSLDPDARLDTVLN